MKRRAAEGKQWRAVGVAETWSAPRSEALEIASGGFRLQRWQTCCFTEKRPAALDCSAKPHATVM